MSFPGKAIIRTPGIEGYALRQARAVPSNVAGSLLRQGNWPFAQVVLMAEIRGYDANPTAS